MSRKFKYPPEIKVKACEEYLSGCYSIFEICNRYGINNKNGVCSIYEWLPIYKKSGAEGFFYAEQKNKQYSKELKLQAVEDYLSSKGSLRDISITYKIKDTRTLRSWISLYNARNLRIAVLKGRSIWQKQDERQPSKNAKKSLSIVLITNGIIKTQLRYMMFLIVRFILG